MVLLRVPNVLLFVGRDFEALPTIFFIGGAYVKNNAV